MREAFTFDDVLIVPKFSDVSSRKDVDLGVSTSKKVFKGISVGFPVISANMDTITGSNMAKAMLNYGGQACLHRFCTIEENVKMLNESETPIEPGDDEYYMRPMVSIGLGKSELDRAYALYGNNATSFIIDVANGAQQAVVDQAKALHEMLKGYGSVIVGNFANADSVKDFLDRTGNIIDGIKVGIGPGSACTTRIKTGVGYPQLSAVLEISRLLKNTEIAVIADGGMRTPGDIAKALGAGAHVVMLGGMLAGTEETPGEIILGNAWEPLYGVMEPRGPLERLTSDGRYSWVERATEPLKRYRGSASKESYEVQGKDASWRTAEGESFTVPYKGPVKGVLQDIEGGLRSAFTYVGARNLKEFHGKVEFVKVSVSTMAENGAHGKK